MSKESELQIVYKNNLLIKSSYNLNLIENRFYLTILFNMQKSEIGLYTCEIHKNDFLKLIRHNTEKRFKGINNILKNLSKKLIEIHEFRKNSNGTEYVFSMINGYKYDKDTSIYKIELSTIMYDLIISYMEGGYTPLNLGVLLGLNNYYAQRFYELLRLWSGTKTKINYTLEYIRESFQLQEKYPNYNNFNRYVIKPSIESLNSTEKFKISYSEIKEGRKVISIDFIVEDLETRTYELDESRKAKEVEVMKIEEEYKVGHKTTVQTPTEIAVQPINLIKSDSNSIDLSDLKKPVQRLFIKDFKKYDFTIEYINEAFDYAISVVMEKDDVEIIGTRQYPIFKKILLAMIEKGEQLDIDKFVNDLENSLFW